MPTQGKVNDHMIGIVRSELKWGKNLSDFAFPDLKLHNRYCHTTYRLWFLYLFIFVIYFVRNWEEKAIRHQSRIAKNQFCTPESRPQHYM